MITRVASIAFSGINIVNVDVQAQLTSGMPNFIIVGLADKTVAESKERVRGALTALGLSLPAKRIIINLSPADLVKEGSHFDLAIAVSLLADLGVLPAEEVKDYIILGELALDGSIVSTNGILPAAIGATAGGKGLICSKANASEAAWSGNSRILAPSNLLELINHFKGTQVLSQPQVNMLNEEVIYKDLNEISGQRVAKRALEIAAAGSHNMLMFGPPGSGKSMLAERLPGILPSLSAKEMLEVSMISSIKGDIKDGQLVRAKPFRAPHHSCSVAAMVGGGMSKRIKPGEITLAHNGVLFLDELPEFSTNVIESLRQPIESRVVNIARSGANIEFPANFQLVAAMNPCRCGFVSDPERACSKAPICAQNYQSKISGPIIDRFDITIEVGNDESYHYDLTEIRKNEESSKEVLKRVTKAREIQAERFEGYGITTNSGMNGDMIIDYAIPDEDGKKILNEATKKFKLSMRAYNRILKVGRSIADLSGSKLVKREHIAEALSYRHMDYC